VVGRYVVPEIILGPDQKLLPDDISRRRIEAAVDKQRLVFGWVVETILGEKKASEHIRQSRGRRVG